MWTRRCKTSRQTRRSKISHMPHATTINKPKSLNKASNPRTPRPWGYTTIDQQSGGSGRVVEQTDFATIRQRTVKYHSGTPRQDKRRTCRVHKPPGSKVDGGRVKRQSTVPPIPRRQQAVEQHTGRTLSDLIRGALRHGETPQL